MSPPLNVNVCSKVVVSLDHLCRTVCALLQGARSVAADDHSELACLAIKWSMQYVGCWAAYFLADRHCLWPRVSPEDELRCVAGGEARGNSRLRRGEEIRDETRALICDALSACSRCAALPAHSPHFGGQARFIPPRDGGRPLKATFCI